VRQLNERSCETLQFETPTDLTPVLRQRPSFATAVEGWLTKAEHARYDNFEPDPWPRVRLLLQTA
jgi:hypothetical protein